MEFAPHYFTFMAQAAKDKVNIFDKEFFQMSTPHLFWKIPRQNCILYYDLTLVSFDCISKIALVWKTKPQILSLLEQYVSGST